MELSKDVLEFVRNGAEHAKTIGLECGLRIRFELFPYIDGMPEFNSDRHCGILETVVLPEELEELIGKSD